MSSDLTKTDSWNSPRKMISRSEIETSLSYVQLSNGVKIFDATEIDARESIVDSLANGVAILGSVGKTPELKFAAKEIRLRTLELFPYITLEEIKEAIRRGAAGDYGEYHGINVKSCLHFIKCFLRNEERLAAIQKSESKQIEEPPKVMTVRDWKNAILNDYRLFKEGNSGVIVFMPKKYALLESLGKISISDEQAEEWMWRSKIEMENRKTLKAKLKKDKDMLSEIKQIASEFESGEMSEKSESAIANNAQRMIYMDFLSRMHSQNIENFFE